MRRRQCPGVGAEGVVSGFSRTGGARIGVETCMRLWHKAFAAASCVAVLACGSSEPDSPLLLDSDEKNVAPGMRTLTSAQSRALQNAVMSAGEPCDDVDRAYLRHADLGKSETWDVRCLDRAYSVHIVAEGTPAADVQRCFGWFAEGCADPFARRRFRQSPERQDRPGPLNPDLGKLLEKMDSQGPKKE